jgi:glutamate synthase (NADPH/NADH) small chain
VVVKNIRTVAPHRTPMPEQPAEIRAHNFLEVNLGFSLDSAIGEANRCLGCKKPMCVPGCPVGIDIPGFVVALSKRDIKKAYRILKQSNALPAVCGRVCPQESQCEATCIVGRKLEPVAIGRLERFVADFALGRGWDEASDVPPTGRKVAVVGSGPAGLACAGDLIKLGVGVTVFEALHVAGGVLKYGIPDFRLPSRIIDLEVDNLRKQGVRFELDAVIGRLYTIPQLMGEMGFDAVFVGTGAGSPKFMNVPGESLNGVFSANEFLTRVNLMKGNEQPIYDTPVGIGRRVAVVGAGNTAMDGARVAKRLGADEVTIVYRRSERESPARVEELHHAKDEGVLFRWLTNPVRIFGNDGGWVCGMECVRMELGEPDESGRRRPVPVAGSEMVLDVDTVICALGTSANPVIAQTTPGLAINKWGYIVADETTGATSIPGVFAGGDIVTGAATVILAMGAGRNAANGILRYLGLKRPAEARA